MPVDEGVAAVASDTAGGEEQLQQWRDEYRKDAILQVSLCFRSDQFMLSCFNNNLQLKLPCLINLRVQGVL